MMAADADETDKNTGTADFNTQLSQFDMFGLDVKILIVADGGEISFKQLPDDGKIYDSEEQSTTFEVPCIIP